MATAAETVTWYGAGQTTGGLLFRAGTFALAGTYATGGVAITTAATKFGSTFTTIKTMIFSEWGPYSFEFVPGATITDGKVKIHDITKTNANRPGHRHDVAAHSHNAAAQSHTVTDTGHTHAASSHTHVGGAHTHIGGAHTHAITTSNFEHSHTTSGGAATWTGTPVADSGGAVATDSSGAVAGASGGTATTSGTTGITIAPHGTDAVTTCALVYTGPSGVKAADGLQTWSGITSSISTELAAATDVSAISGCTILVIGT